MNPLDNVALRPEREEDRSFLETLYASTREQELAPVDWSAEKKLEFLRVQFAMQHAYYHQVYPSARYDVIELNGEAVGRLYVDRTAEELRILDIALVSSVRGQGIGGALMTALMDEAAAQARTVGLSVERSNAARRLYERLGFETCEETEVYLHLAWRSAKAAACC
jgi:ribosomal protein S18 acetylase RimI-like enzyme